MRTRPSVLYSSLLFSAVFFVFCLGERVHAENQVDSVPPAHRRIADGADLFTDATVEKGKAIIMRINRVHEVDVLVETMDKIPADNLRSINGAKNPAREFQAWAKQRAAEARVDGIYILISVDPNHKQTVVIARPVAKYEKTFSRDDVEDTRRYFSSRKFTENYNQGLLDGLEVVNETLAENTKTSYTIPWLSLGFLFIGGVGVWLLLSLLRLKNRQEEDDDPTNGPSTDSTSGQLYP